MTDIARRYIVVIQAPEGYTRRTRRSKMHHRSQTP